ncbi:MAG: antibiotic biosynthesis monooxygenase [Gammaproteobacteria bacterium]|nr:antibiotic biosynthesis monooxygenase [Gammaproteobacteria bacterium]
MKNSQFTVMIAGIAKAGMEDYVKRFLLQLAKSSRQDEGCLVYNIHQSESNPAEFMLYSVWSDQAAFDAHNQTMHMQEFKRQLATDMFEIQSPKTYWQLIGEED